MTAADLLDDQVEQPRELLLMAYPMRVGAAADVIARCPLNMATVRGRLDTLTSITVECSCARGEDECIGPTRAEVHLTVLRDRQLMASAVRAGQFVERMSEQTQHEQALWMMTEELRHVASFQIEETAEPLLASQEIHLVNHHGTPRIVRDSTAVVTGYALGADGTHVPFSVGLRCSSGCMAVEQWLVTGATVRHTTLGTEPAR